MIAWNSLLTSSTVICVVCTLVVELIQRNDYVLSESQQSDPFPSFMY